MPPPLVGWLVDIFTRIGNIDSKSNFGREDDVFSFGGLSFILSI